MKMRNVGPKNITRSVLEGPKKKTKRTIQADDKRKQDDLDALMTKGKKAGAPKDGTKLKKKSRIQEEFDSGEEELDHMDPDVQAKLRAKKKKRLDKERQKIEVLLDKEPKKKKPGTAVALRINREVSPLMDPSTLKKVDSFFGGRSDKIMEMLEMGDNDGGISILKKTLLQTVVRTIPAAEAILTQSGTSKGTYQFVTLISQVRELIADIQADKDKQYIAQSILATIIQPAFLEVAQLMITKHYEFRKRTEAYVNPKHAQAFSEALVSLAKELAGDMQIQYRDISVKLTEALKT